MANSKYKLIYYDWTGVAEITRFIFAYANVPYEDERFPAEPNLPVMLPEMKAKFPWGQVPVLEVDGRVIAQSRAINRFLAHRFGLAGKDDYESAKCDEIVDSLVDYTTEFRPYFWESDPAKLREIMKNLLEVVTPKFLRKFNELIERASKGGDGVYLVGESLTWADFVVHQTLKHYEDYCGIRLYSSKEYPALERAKESFYDIPAIKNWVGVRPKPAMPLNAEIFQEIVQKWSQ